VSDAASRREFFAAVDLGSNSFHMIVARHEDGQLRVVDRLRDMVRLAAGVLENRDLAPEAVERALACLARFGERLQGIPSERVSALGTNTLRRARNPRVFLQLAENALGHPIDIISAHEEARLIYTGVAHDMAPAGRRLVIDIGGGSTEFILGEGHTPQELDSASVGCVSVTEAFFPGGGITRKRFKEAQTAVALELRPLRKMFRSGRWDEVVGSSGTIRTVAEALQEAGWGHGTITWPGFKKLRKTLERAGHVDRIAVQAVSTERRPVFPGGLAIIEACFRSLELAEMRVSQAALREGALYDLIGRSRHEDPRAASVAAFAAQYRVDTAHANRVRSTALAGFDQVASSWNLATTYREMLGWAAELHEVGLAITHDHYQRHGFYLVAHSNLSGFSRGEQLVLATMIMGHRRGLVPDAFDALPERRVDPVRKSTAILRIAVLLHRTRLRDQVPPIEWRADGNTLDLTFPPGWLDRHPLTAADLRVEQKRLRKIELALEYR
jgi:exopolyphosphatase/guanosine-5'-triphosphate,3'-diphosphate pyrophosphatase